MRARDVWTSCCDCRSPRPSVFGATHSERPVFENARVASGCGRAIARMQLNPMNSRGALPVHERRSVALLQWRVLELSNGTAILGGVLDEQPTLRTTTPIVTQQGRHFTTSSGRSYTLVGAPASDQDVLMCLAVHLFLLGLHTKSDITEQHWLAIQAADQRGDGDRRRLRRRSGERWPDLDPDGLNRKHAAISS